jgi:hypothetical protein
MHGPVGTGSLHCETHYLLREVFWGALYDMMIPLKQMNTQLIL